MKNEWGISTEEVDEMNKDISYMNKTVVNRQNELKEIKKFTFITWASVVLTLTTIVVGICADIYESEATK
jgi:hypothetical protein